MIKTHQKPPAALKKADFFTSFTSFANISHNPEFKASIDIGNVSYAVPAIHPFFDILNGSQAASHTREFAAASITEYGLEQMYKMAEVLAETGYRVMTQPDVYAQIREEFATATKK